MPSETYGSNGVTPIFRSFFTELPDPSQAAGVVGTFKCAFIYNSQHYGLILEDTILFLQGLPFFRFCVHFHFPPASTLCMCVMYVTSFDGLF